MNLFHFATVALILLCNPVNALEVYLVRHGETDWNAEDRLQGQADIPLNAHGIDQCQQLAEKLAYIQFDACYASDLSRAYDTASILTADYNLTVVPDSRLRELDCGIFEGRYIDDELREAFTRALLSESEDHSDGVERLNAFCVRVDEVMDELLEAHSEDERIMIVCHGGVARMMLERLDFEIEGEKVIRLPNANYLCMTVDDEGERVITHIDGWDSPSIVGGGFSW
ncbi:Probable phosphoglycerate mutase GpmB [Chlamydiales bacterium SCGC AG-110-P3]|nr:Probable phosphoglycerate mutase GpmB [Chlamydiales bacterium SCGC AG-110-P3]